MSEFIALPNLFRDSIELGNVFVICRVGRICRIQLPDRDRVGVVRICFCQRWRSRRIPTAVNIADLDQTRIPQLTSDSKSLKPSKFPKRGLTAF
jgi:hypothetical protein